MSEHHGRDWTISYERRAEKDIARLDPPVRKRVVRKRVLAAIDKLVADPVHATGVRKLTGRSKSRLRVGDGTGQTMADLSWDEDVGAAAGM
jgi:mRNA-degrading endonuclease RelE of RelBE toxin-antitoxin system